MKKTTFVMRISSALLVFITTLLVLSSCATVDAFFGTDTVALTWKQVIPNGTYTYYPRPRAYQAGVDKNAYIAKIVVEGENVSVYISNVPEGVGGYYSIDGFGGWERAILQDLDNPSKSYTPSNAKSDSETQCMVISYIRVSARRISIATGDSAPFVFDEIVAGEPDQTDTRASISNGTYTYYPRLRAMQAGVDKDAYLAKIAVKGENVSIYISNVPLGAGGYYSIAGFGGWGNALLQDLDYPSRIYVPVEATSDRDTQCMVVSYKVARGSRFTLRTGDNPAYIFEEIVIGEPDRPDTRANIPSGTYTYYPRLRAAQTGVDKDAYITKIAVRGGYLNVYISNVPQGVGGYYSIAGFGGWGNALLQDLDDPSKVYNSSNSTSDSETQCMVVTYQVSKGSRFSLKTGDSPPFVFEEVIIGDPDQ
jgi:hypothetical protein